MDDKPKKLWLIHITVNVPYPKTMPFRIEASNPFLAINRAKKEVRKQLGRKRISNHGSATWQKIV